MYLVAVARYPIIQPRVQRDHSYSCPDYSHAQHSPLKLCEKYQSRKLEHKGVVEQMLGEH